MNFTPLDQERYLGSCASGIFVNFELMGKKGKSEKKGPRNPKKIRLHDEDADISAMDDEIDAFHKKRDMIPLDINDDVDSDEDDDVQPVFDYEGIDGDDDEDEDDDDDDDDDGHRTDLAVKIARQHKYLREKFGGVEDEMHDGEEEDEKKKTVWSREKGPYYGGDNKDYELQSSDEDTPAEEEEEVIKLQKERAESLRAEDFGLQIEQEDSDEEPTLEELMVKGKNTSKSSADKEDEGDAVPSYEEVKKDLSALSRDEQMAIVDSSAPELVGLLAELNDAFDQLETQVNPFLDKVRKGDHAKKEGKHYLEVKQLLLLAYCQAITFYLLLKSEGQPVRDHPVIARLVEIKSLLDKMKELDGNLPDGIEDVLNEESDIVPAKKPAAKHRAFLSNLDIDTPMDGPAVQSADKQETSKFMGMDEPVKSTEVGKKRRRAERQDDPVSSESVKMLQYRAALEEKLKQKGVSGSAHTKTDRSKKQKLKTLAGQLETIDDFDDDAMDLEGTNVNGRHSTLSSKVSKFVTGKDNLRKGLSGDDDMPERDNLGERRWKHELRVLAGAGIKSVDDDVNPENKPESLGNDSREDDVEGNNSETDGSEDEFFKQIKQRRAAKHAMKAEKYSRNQVSYEQEITIDGKRHITTQMEKNRGLTRTRKKLLKNPRKKNRVKHAKAVSRRKGQVRDIKKPSGPYGGETTGINTRISRSIRFKG